MQKFYILIFLSMFANLAYAKDEGRWLCTDCELVPVGTPTAAMDMFYITKFIKSEVNPSKSIWIGGDIITVCDGNICLIMQYQSGGVWIPFGGTFKDNGRGYKNSKTSLTSGVVGGNGSNFSLAFRNVDYAGTVTYDRTRVISVTAGPIIPRPDLYSPAPFGEGFSSGFNWGGGLDSDSWSSQGGYCKSNGTCVREF